MRSESIENGIRCLWWLKTSSEGLWGSEAGNPSRVTNTAEAVWALAAFLEPEQVSKDLSTAIQFLERAALGDNEGEGKSCEHAREFAWVLWALSRAGVGLEEEGFRKSVEWLVDNQNKAKYGGWFNPDHNKEDATQFTSLAILALLEATQKESGQEKDSGLITRAKIRIHEGVNSLSRTGGESQRWGELNASDPHPAYTAYAVCALQAFYVRNSDESPDGIEKALEYLLKCSKSEEMMATTTDVDGSYRHFTKAWVLYALASDHQTINDEATFALACSLIFSRNQRTDDSGWTGGSRAATSTTWGTADALVALQTFSGGLRLDSTLRTFGSQRACLEGLAKELRDYKEGGNLRKELRYVWKVRGKTLAAARDPVFWALFLLYVLCAAFLAHLNPFNVPLKWLLRGLSLPLNFFWYSFWRQRLEQKIPSVILFLIGINGLIFAILTWIPD